MECSDICALNVYTITGAQNAGRMERLHEAQEMGVVIKKKWLATMDKRTRDVHRDELNGVEVDVDEPFHTSLGDIMFPGDPNADPANTYNCRCTLVYVYDVKASANNIGKSRKMRRSSCLKKRSGGENPLPEPEYNPGCDDRTVISPLFPVCDHRCFRAVEKSVICDACGFDLGGLVWYNKIEKVYGALFFGSEARFATAIMLDGSI